MGWWHSRTCAGERGGGDDGEPGEAEGVGGAQAGVDGVGQQRRVGLGSVCRRVARRRGEEVKGGDGGGGERRAMGRCVFLRWGKKKGCGGSTWAGLAVAWRVAAEGWKGSALTRKDDEAAADSGGGCVVASGSRGRTRKMALPVPAMGA